MLGIRHIALRVRDVGRSLEFYTKIMGMRVEWTPDPDNVYLTSGTDNLALHKATAESETSSGSAGTLDHFGFVVAKPEEVDEWAGKLESLGIVLAQMPRTHRDGARSIYFHDPDGNLIQLLYHPPIS